MAHSEYYKSFRVREYGSLMRELGGEKDPKRAAELRQEATELYDWILDNVIYPREHDAQGTA